MALAGLENTAGAKIYIAEGVPDSYAAADLADLTWVHIVGVVSFGEWGNEESDVSETVLSEDQVIHTNGIADGGSVPISIQHRTTDAGGDLVKTVGGTNDLVTLMKVYTAGSGEGEVATAIITSPKRRSAEGNTVRGYTVNARINTKVTDLSAADVTTALA